MLTETLRSLIFRYCTPQCDLCGLTIDDPHSSTIWCKNCQRYFQPQPRCRCCGLPTQALTDKCGQCLTTPPLWNRLYCIGDYQPPLSGYIHQMKYNNRYRFAYDLSYLLTVGIDQPAPELLPVPVHWTRYLKRGYNQSWVLAYYLSQHLENSRVNNKVFKKIRSTPPQQGLSMTARQTNLRGAFQLVQPPQSDHVAIIDDVVTTGNTVHHLCTLLLDIGVKKIDIYSICRTPEPSQM